VHTAELQSKSFQVAADMARLRERRPQVISMTCFRVTASPRKSTRFSPCSVSTAQRLSSASPRGPRI